MNKETQIEEMTQAIYETNNSYDTYWESHCKDLATELYDAGYRKQKWISVEDRLPTWEDGKVLIYTVFGISIAERTVSGHWRGKDAIPKFITHWMPLPEPPKMKGGAE